MGRIRTRQEIRAVIAVPPNLHAGWMLTAYETSDWQWCRIREIGEMLYEIAYLRDCSEAEKKDLNHLLWTAQICMRFKRIREGDGNPWAPASID